jgi:hypothetical protein
MHVMCGRLLSTVQGGFVGMWSSDVFCLTLAVIRHRGCFCPECVHHASALLIQDGKLYPGMNITVQIVFIVDNTVFAVGDEVMSCNSFLVLTVRFLH